MRRVYRLLPGPPLLRATILMVLILGVLALLALAFERAGDFLDDGGVIGGWPA